MAGYLRLDADRYVVTIIRIKFHGVDLTGWDLMMQVRLYRDAPGAALREFKLGSGLVLESVGTLDGAPLSTVRLTVPANVFPYAAERSADLALAHDLLVQRPDTSVWERWLFGPFIILAGVTQNG
ncbi:hypothetical protein HY78_18665 [Rhizorhabdus wittichii DC-6]|nr:hypothetical protein HY78_18665 [Rhizorhabdus wittichii DC-6]